MAPAATPSRVRTSFDPEHELPRLHQWFAENPHPSRLTLQMYVKELNSLPSRQTRKLLEVHNLCYWFKNARAAYKRAELRMRRESAEPHARLAHQHQCQPHYKPVQQHQQHLASHLPAALHQSLPNDSNSPSPVSGLSPSGSPPPPPLATNLVGPGIEPAQLAALKLVPPVVDLKSLLVASRSVVAAQAATAMGAAIPPSPPIQPLPAAPPLAPFSELDTDRSLYLLLFFMKFFDLDNCWQRNITTN